MSPDGSTMASYEDVNILEKLVLLLGRHPFNNEIPRV
ncbi:hypothetical protein Tco_0538892, partial [Tanacetum coccineum]